MHVPGIHSKSSGFIFISSLISRQWFHNLDLNRFVDSNHKMKENLNIIESPSYLESVIFHLNHIPKSSYKYTYVLKDLIDNRRNCRNNLYLKPVLFKKLDLTLPFALLVSICLLECILIIQNNTFILIAYTY